MSCFCKKHCVCGSYGHFLVFVKKKKNKVVKNVSLAWREGSKSTFYRFCVSPGFVTTRFE